MTYYTRSALARYNLARAEAINAELAAIEAGFAKLPVDPLLATGAATWATAAGGPNAYTLTLPVTPTAYTDGMRIVFPATGANTDIMTVDVNGLGVKSVVANGTGGGIAAGEVSDGSVLEIVYSGTKFRLLEKVTAVTVDAALTDLGALAFSDTVGASQIEISGSLIENYVVAIDDEGGLKAVAQSGGLSTVTSPNPTVTDGTTLTAALHGALTPNGSALEDRWTIAKHASDPSGTAVDLLLEEDFTGRIVLRQAAAQLFPVQVACIGSNTFEGGATSIKLGGPGSKVTIRSTEVAGVFAVEGEFVGLGTIVGGIASPVLDSADATTPHTLTMAEHAGRTVLMTGNTTVPATDGFSATLIASGANRDVNAGGAALTVDSGDAITVFSDGTTVWNTPAITLATLATS